MELIEGPSLDKVIKQMRREAEGSNQRSVISDLEGTKKAIAQAEIFQAHAGQVRMLRSIVALHTGNYSEAIEHAQQAVRLMPESVAAWAVLCRAGNLGGQWPLAMDARAKMKSLPSKSAEDYTLKAYGEMFPEGDETVRWLDKAVSLRPNFFLAYAMRAEQRTVVALDNPEGTGAEGAAGFWGSVQGVGARLWTRRSGSLPIGWTFSVEWNVASSGCTTFRGPRHADDIGELSLLMLNRR